jgi:hypothetical protein
MRVMTTPLPAIMISGRCRFCFCRRRCAFISVTIFMAMVACHSVERKGENPHPHCGTHFKSAG